MMKNRLCMNLAETEYNVSAERILVSWLKKCDGKIKFAMLQTKLKTFPSSLKKEHFDAFMSDSIE